jgi:hypothetical protein
LSETAVLRSSTLTRAGEKMRVMKTSPVAQEAPCHGRSDGIFSQLLTIRCAPDLERIFTKHNGPIEPRKDLIGRSVLPWCSAISSFDIGHGVHRRKQVIPGVVKQLSN